MFSSRTVDFSQAKILKMNNTKVKRFELEFMLDTLNIYSPLNFSNRRVRAEGIKKIIEEGTQETEAPKEDNFAKNKTYERIMNEAKEKRNESHSKS